MKPETDKILCCWIGMLIATLAGRGASYRPRRARCIVGVCWASSGEVPLPISANFICKSISTLQTYVHALNRIPKQAAQALKAMPRNISVTIREKIDALAADPYAPNPNAKKLAGQPGYRLRAIGVCCTKSKTAAL
ncbi:type II toxin-antitoxin system RelE family toxin [Burkholderia metallica]|uniref:type II toxin-antitoxin system RelE family toxin n=1 Tax=Burkholderia metallica TaxID=488729 RepID=UPI001CF51DC7|nr:hypothetical protein [Burkholderia metallica]MCA7999424.1 hypothetical protein [Burkholderia metallica]